MEFIYISVGADMDASTKFAWFLKYFNRQFCYLFSLISLGITYSDHFVWWCCYLHRLLAYRTWSLVKSSESYSDVLESKRAADFIFLTLECRESWYPWNLNVSLKPKCADSSAQVLAMNWGWGAVPGKQSLTDGHGILDSQHLPAGKSLVQATAALCFFSFQSSCTDCSLL